MCTVGKTFCIEETVPVKQIEEVLGAREEGQEKAGTAFQHDWNQTILQFLSKLRDHPRSLDTHHSAPQTCDRIRNFLRKVTNSFCFSHPHQENALIYIFCHKTFRQGVSFWSETRKSRWQKSVSWQIGTPPVSVVIIYYYTNKKSDPSSHKPDFWLCLFGGGVGRE